MTNRDKLNKVITNDFDINNNYTSIRKKMERGNKMNKIFKYSLVPMAIVITMTGVFLLNKKSITNNVLDSNVKTSDVTNMIKEIKNIPGIDFALSLSEFEKLGLSENVIPDELLKIFKSGKYQMVLVNSIYEVASDEINNQITLVNDIVKKYDKTAIVAG